MAAGTQIGNLLYLDATNINIATTNDRSGITGVTQIIYAK